MFQQEEIGMQRYRTERNNLQVSPISKIVIRHLPPTMTEEEFLLQVDPLPEHDFYYFSEADWSLGRDATCRAYITFKNDEDVFLFRDRFDGYVFVDKKGNEYAAIVEFAPFQGFGKPKTRCSDNMVNTIEQQPHYQQFLKKLDEERVAASKSTENKLQFSLITKKEKVTTTTPLLEFLARKNEKRPEVSNKRTADKKKRRGNDKDKRKQNPAPTLVQPGKILTSEKSDQRPVQANNEVKNVRTSRNEERNHLCHVAYLQPKKTHKEQRAINKEREAFSAGQNKKENIRILVKSGNEGEAKVGNSHSSSSDIKDNPKDDMKELEDISKLAINNETKGANAKKVEKEINKCESTERERMENQSVSEENYSNSMLAKGMLNLSIADGDNADKKDEPPRQKKVQWPLRL